MHTERPIILRRDCEALMIPSGEKLRLACGSTVWLTQALGGSYTIMTDRGYMARLEGKDGDAIGMAQVAATEAQEHDSPDSAQELEQKVWQQLMSCFDPEIPVNIVDLGLVYDCAVTPLDGGYRAAVRFTLTAQGCGMGEVLKRDIEAKLLAIPGVQDTDVALVWDPPWSQSRISPVAKQKLGME